MSLQLLVAPVWARSGAMRRWRSPRALCRDLRRCDRTGRRAVGQSTPGLDSQGLLATIDYKQGFALAGHCMVRLGVPETLARLLVYHWAHQRRWLQWGPHTRSEALWGQGVPQGDPLSRWPSHVCNFVDTSCGSLRPSQHVVYMDDRTWVSKEARSHVAGLTWWQMFSRIVGLKEHPGKTQLVASSAASRHHLAHLNTAAPVS